MRNITDAIKAEKDKKVIIPIELYQIFLPDETLYLATWAHQIAFYNEAEQPEIYLPAAISRRPITRSNTLEVDRFEVSIDNVGQEWSGTVANYDLQGVKVNILKIFLQRNEISRPTYESYNLDSTVDLNREIDTTKELDTYKNYFDEIFGITETTQNEYSVLGDYNDAVPLFSGEIDRPNINKEQITVEIVSKLNVLDKQGPARRFGGRCPWIFGGEECGVNAPTNTGIIQNVDTTGRVITVESLQDTNWTHGSFKAAKNKRVITDYDAVNNTVAVEFPVSTNIVAGESYSIKAGCSKVKDDTTEGCTFWNNKEFFGGFSAIPQIRNIRE